MGGLIYGCFAEWLNIWMSGCTDGCRNGYAYG